MVVPVFSEAQKVEEAEAVQWTSSCAMDRQAHEDQKPLQLEAGLSGHQK